MIQKQRTRNNVPDHVLHEILIHEHETTLDNASPEFMKAFCERCIGFNCQRFEECKANGFNSQTCDHRNRLQGKVRHELYGYNPPSVMIQNSQAAKFESAMFFLFELNGDGLITEEQLNEAIFEMKKIQFDFACNPMQLAKSLYERTKTSK